MINLLPLLEEIAQQYTLDPTGIHGLNHWGRVLETGLTLVGTEGGDETVIRLFAIFHDACRLNQSIDRGHGSRGAQLAEQLLSDLTLVTSSQLDTLIQACREHTDGKTTADVTVQVCWDADRLDLGRAGIIPNPRFLCTRTGKSKATRDWANHRALSNFSPVFVTVEWEPIFENLHPRPQS